MELVDIVKPTPSKFLKVLSMELVYIVKPFTVCEFLKILSMELVYIAKPMFSKCYILGQIQKVRITQEISNNTTSKPAFFKCTV